MLVGRLSVFVLFLSLVGGLRAAVQYFPDRVFCTPKETSCERWYARHLEAMGEPSLWEQSKNRSPESYRFLWLRTFHQPVSARLEIAKNGTAELTVKVLSGMGGYHPGHLVKNGTIKVSKEVVVRFLELLGNAEFWDSPAEQSTGSAVGLDGAQWIMEGTKEGRYHVVDRWSPECGPYRSVALFLVNTLGGVDPVYSEVY